MLSWLQFFIRFIATNKFFFRTHSFSNIIQNFIRIDHNHFITWNDCKNSFDATETHVSTLCLYNHVCFFGVPFRKYPSRSSEDSVAPYIWQIASSATYIQTYLCKYTLEKAKKKKLVIHNIFRIKHLKEKIIREEKSECYGLGLNIILSMTFISFFPALYLGEIIVVP